MSDSLDRLDSSDFYPYMRNFFEGNELTRDKQWPWGEYSTKPSTKTADLSIQSLLITTNDKANLENPVGSSCSGYDAVGKCPKCGLEVCGCGYQWVFHRGQGSRKNMGLLKCQKGMILTIYHEGSDWDTGEFEFLEKSLRETCLLLVDITTLD